MKTKKCYETHKKCNGTTCKYENKEKLQVVDTWLPVFSGFYGTIWEDDGAEEMELGIYERLRGNGVTVQASNYSELIGA